MPTLRSAIVRWRGARAARAVAVACSVVGASFAGRAAVHGQSPVPTPLPTATRIPTALPRAPVPPRGSRVISGLPSCTTNGRMRLTPERVAVGGTVTGTIEISVSCPAGLRSRSAVIVVHGIDADAAPAAQAALTALVDGLGEAGRSSVAILFGDDPPTAPRFAALPAERDTVVAAIAARLPQPATSAAAWADRIEAAATALAAISPTQRPLLVVVDGARPAADVARGLAVLQRTLVALPDRLGFGLVIDVSPEAWLRGLGQGGAVPDTAALYVRPVPLDSLTSLVVEIVDTMQAPIDDWRLEMDLPESTLLLQRTEILIAPLRQPSNAYPWRFRADAHDLAAKAVVELRAVGTGRSIPILTFTGSRRKAGFGPLTFAPPPPFCVYAPGLEADCDPSERATDQGDRGTSTPVAASPPPRATATPTPRRGPQPATPVVGTSAHVLYLPAATR